MSHLGLVEYSPSSQRPFASDWRRDLTCVAGQELMVASARLAESGAQ